MSYVRRVATLTKPASDEAAWLLNEAGSVAPVPSARLLVENDWSTLQQAVRQELRDRLFTEFYPCLSDVLGNYKCALMLGHALYWTRTWLLKNPQREGWFYKTAAQWEEDIGLTAKEQKTARETLLKQGVWLESLRGNPAQLHFKVKMDGLAELLNLPKVPGSETPFDDWEALARRLAQPLSFHKSLAEMCGGSMSQGLVLSHYLVELRQATLAHRVSEQGFFETQVKTGHIHTARLELGLGSKVYRNAREGLIKAGWLQNAWTRDRKRLLSRINLQGVMSCLRTQRGATVLEGAPSSMQAAQATTVRRARPTVSLKHEATASTLSPKALTTQASASRVATRRWITNTGATTTPTPSMPSLLNRAQIIETRRNVVRVDRIAAPAVKQGAGGVAENGKGGVAVLAKLEAEIEGGCCRFGETGVAVLAKLYIQTSKDKPPPPPARTRKRVHVRIDAKAQGGRGRNLEFCFEDTNSEPEKIPSEVQAEVPRRAAPAAKSDPLASEVLPLSIETATPQVAQLQIDPVKHDEARVEATLSLEDDLIWPVDVVGDERKAVLRAMQKAKAPPDVWQHVIDEWEGRRHRQPPVLSNMGFIRRVAENAANGEPTWDTRFEVEKRRNRLETEKRKQQQSHPSTPNEAENTRKATPMPEHLRKKFGLDKRRMDGSSMQSAQAEPLEQNGTMVQPELLGQNDSMVQPELLGQNDSIMKGLTKDE
jgi:hypothetical protein